MPTKRHSSRRWILGALGALALAVTAGLPVSGARGWGAALRRLVEPAAPQELITLESRYIGQVDLQWAAAGVYSDTLTAPAGTLPDLGSIGLGLWVHCAEDKLTGYVDLEATLVFTQEHVIATTQAITTPVAVGPAVSGTCGQAGWHLESEPFSLTTEAGQTVTRQFHLTGAWTSPDALAGEYRETLWGYSPQPATIVGNFTLAQTAGTNLYYTNQLYLPLIKH